jgi:hypothetical protein
MWQQELARFGHFQVVKQRLTFRRSNTIEPEEMPSPGAKEVLTCRRHGAVDHAKTIGIRITEFETQSTLDELVRMLWFRNRCWREYAFEDNFEVVMREIETRISKNAENYHVRQVKCDPS